MAITYGDYLIDIGANEMTSEQERELDAREECSRRGIDPDEICADGGVAAWMVVDQERRNGIDWREERNKGAVVAALRRARDAKRDQAR